METPGVASELQVHAVARSGVRVPGDLLVHLRAARDEIDRHFAEPIDLDRVAAVAGISKFHFHRLFSATYGLTPSSYLTQRRIERAQDLLRATNLTVTEVCFAVGYSSLGSFSSRFKELVGETASSVQARYSASGAPRVPGCFVFMWGLAERRHGQIVEEQRPARRGGAETGTVSR
ncbi:MAG TPA: AraC family transcriptional regulator [Ilumatobacteraceae bacterium]|nr:AraC family transcriptional regulator [Ilumatobacteraceae bacterium]